MSQIALVRRLALQRSETKFGYFSPLRFPVQVVTLYYRDGDSNCQCSPLILQIHEFSLLIDTILCTRCKSEAESRVPTQKKSETNSMGGNQGLTTKNRLLATANGRLCKSRPSASKVSCHNYVIFFTFQYRATADPRCVSCGVGSTGGWKWAGPPKVSPDSEIGR